MSRVDDVTICITMGLRPDHLQASIESLGPELRKLPIVAINDFGDEPTNEKFKEICPHGELVKLGERVGHMRAVDAIYKRVRTPYILHIEDDWEFTRVDFLDDAKTVLGASDKITSVCFRSMSDIKVNKKNRPNIMQTEYEGVAVTRLDTTSDEWYGHSFNPHLARKSLWQELGGFSQFRGEGVISRHFRKIGRHNVLLNPGACHHIGWEESVRRGHVAEDDAAS